MRIAVEMVSVGAAAPVPLTTAAVNEPSTSTLAPSSMVKLAVPAPPTSKVLEVQLVPAPVTATAPGEETLVHRGEQGVEEAAHDVSVAAQGAVEMVEGAADAAAVFAGVTGDQWDRVGRRSNGSVFTVRTLGVYYLHDVVHHLHDIGR